jgi:hypothetical protein
MSLPRIQAEEWAEISIAIRSRMEVYLLTVDRKSSPAFGPLQVTGALLVEEAVAVAFQAEGGEVGHMTATEAMLAPGTAGDGIEDLLEMIGTTTRTGNEVFDTTGRRVRRWTAYIFGLQAGARRKAVVYSYYVGL